MATNERSYLVGDFRVDPETRTIIGSEGAKYVSRESIKVMGALTAKAGQTVRSEHIKDDLWRNDPTADQNLMACISSLRKGFGDTRRRPKYIETVNGIGYRLVAPVHGLDEAISGRHIPDGQRFDKAPKPSFWIFLLELRQRKVCRAALLYALVVWLILQIGDVVFEALRLPDWALSFVAITAILGFPIAMVLAWTFEVTPDGLVLDIPCAMDRTEEHPIRESRWNLALLAASSIVSLQMILSGFDVFSPSSNRLERLTNVNSVVVTPFQATNVSLETKAYAFALSEQLRYLLNTDLQVDVIAFEGQQSLNTGFQRADIILQGSVTVAPNAILIMVHLVDPYSGQYVWSEEFSMIGSQYDFGHSNAAKMIISRLPIGESKIPQRDRSLTTDASTGSSKSNSGRGTEPLGSDR